VSIENNDIPIDIRKDIGIVKKSKTETERKMDCLRS